MQLIAPGGVWCWRWVDYIGYLMFNAKNVLRVFVTCVWTTFVVSLCCPEFSHSITKKKRDISARRRQGLKINTSSRLQGAPFKLGICIFCHSIQSSLERDRPNPLRLRVCLSDCGLCQSCLEVLCVWRHLSCVHVSVEFTSCSLGFYKKRNVLV